VQTQKIITLAKVFKKELRVTLVGFDTGFAGKPDGKPSKQMDK